MSKINVEECAIDSNPFTEPTVEVPSKEEWHPRYEWIGKWARTQAKHLFITLVPYIIWGLVFSWAFQTGGYSGLIITVSVSILYTIRNLKLER